MSELKLISMGMVLVDKEVNSWKIEVKLLEKNGYANGTVDNAPEEHEATGVDKDGVTYTDKVIAKSGLVAHWFPSMSHQISAPDVCKGEVVEVWKYGDSDKYYWKATNMATHLRKLETRTIAISNKPKVDKKPLDHNNSYYHEMCTRTKTITIGTSKNDGEQYKYIIQINAKNGNVVIEDDVGNNFFLDSNNSKLLMESSKGSSISVSKDIDIVSGGNVNINGKNIATNGKLTNNGVNVGSTHKHYEQGDGNPVSTPF